VYIGVLLCAVHDMLVWYVHVESRKHVQCSLSVLMTIAIRSQRGRHCHSRQRPTYNLVLDMRYLIFTANFTFDSLYTGQISSDDNAVWIALSSFETSRLDSHRMRCPVRAIRPMYVSHQVLSTSLPSNFLLAMICYTTRIAVPCVLRSAAPPRLSRRCDRINSCSTAELCPNQSATDCV